MLQAIAASVPVVATDTGGVAEVVSHGKTGLLVPPGQPAAAADAILVLAGDPGARARFARSARFELGDEFDIRRMVGDLEDLYDDVLAGGRPNTPAATSASHLGVPPSRH